MNPKDNIPVINNYGVMQPGYYQNQNSIPVAPPISSNTVIQGPPNVYVTSPSTIGAQTPSYMYTPSAPISQPIASNTNPQAPSYVYNPNDGYVPPIIASTAVPISQNPQPQAYVPVQNSTLPTTVTVPIESMPQVNVRYDQMPTNRAPNSGYSQEIVTLVKLIRTCYWYTFFYVLINAMAILGTSELLSILFIFILNMILCLCFMVSLSSVKKCGAGFSLAIMIIYTIVLILDAIYYFDHTYLIYSIMETYDVSAKIVFWVLYGTYFVLSLCETILISRYLDKLGHYNGNIEILRRAVKDYFKSSTSC